MRGLSWLLLGAAVARIRSKPNTEEQAPRPVDFGTAFLVAASALRTVLQFAMLPILAWRLAPEAYGLIGLAISVIMLPRLFLDGGLEAALVVAQDHTDRLEASCFWSTFFAGCAGTALVAVTAPWIALLFREPALENLLIFLSPILVLSALCTVPNARLMRHSRLSSFAIGDVASTLVGAAIALYGAFHGWGVWCLAGQQLALWAIKWAIVTWLSGYRPKFYLDIGIIKTRAVFSLLNLGSILVDFLQRNVEKFIIGGLIGVQGLGYYSMSYQIMLMPQTVVALPMSTSVFTSTARAAAAREDVGALYLTALEIMTMILAPGMLGLALVADLATVGILGERWAPAAAVLALLLPGGFIQCVLQLGNAAVLGVGQGYHRFRLSLLAALPAIVGILIGASFGIRGVAAGLSVGMLASLVPCMAITLRETRVTLALMIGAVTAPVLATVVMGVAVIAFRVAYAPSSSFVALMECGGIGILSYAIALLGFGRTRSRVLIKTLMARGLPVR